MPARPVDGRRAPVELVVGRRTPAGSAPGATLAGVELRAADLAAAVGGRLDGPDVTVQGASIDSRAVRAGQLFVPIVAGRDGHQFVEAAMAAGAAAYLTARDSLGGTAVVVDDTGRALLDAGRLARTRLAGPVVGITGSVGKTSAKDLLAAVLRRRLRTTASERSFNNELGVPLTLLNAPDDAEVAIVEMGARGPGHIAALCSVAHPTIGLVTRIAPSHTEAFGSIDGIAKAKGELVEALPADGTAVLNAFDERVMAMAARTPARVLTFGVGGDVSAEDVTLDGALHPRFRLCTPHGEADVALTVSGLHMVENALAAAAAAIAVGLGVDAVAEGFADATLSPHRMALLTLPSGARLLDDAYNANPTSMTSALQSLASLDAVRRVAVLGVMAELDNSAAEHAAIGRLARELGIEVISVAAPDYGGLGCQRHRRRAQCAGRAGPRRCSVGQGQSRRRPRTPC